MHSRGSRETLHKQPRMTIPVKDVSIGLASFVTSRAQPVFRKARSQSTRASVWKSGGGQPEGLKKPE